VRNYQTTSDHDMRSDTPKSLREGGVVPGSRATEL
jgi:hypothetical protein